MRLIYSATLKFSIGPFPLRIAVSRVQRTIISSVIGVSAVVCTCCFFIIVFQCWPVAYFWGQFTGMEESYINPIITRVSTYAYSIMSCWSDWTYCILLAFMVWNLRINRRSKIIVFIIISVGSVWVFFQHIVKVFTFTPTFLLFPSSPFFLHVPSPDLIIISNNIKRLCTRNCLYSIPSQARGEFRFPLCCHRHVSGVCRRDRPRYFSLRLNNSPSALP